MHGLGRFSRQKECFLFSDFLDAVSSTNGDPIIAKYTLELRYPLSLNPQATFFGLAFLEAGNTYPNFKNFNPFNVKQSAGIGIRVFLPMFGMLGLDAGWGFNLLDPGSKGYTPGMDDHYQGSHNWDVINKGAHFKLNFTIGMNLGEL